MGACIPGYPGYYYAGARVPPDLIGVPPATLQQWLTQAQQAYQDLMMGNKPEIVSYTQGDGNRSVTYTRANLGALQQRIRELTAALGLSAPRHAIGVLF